MPSTVHSADGMLSVDHSGRHPPIVCGPLRIASGYMDFAVARLGCEQMQLYCLVALHPTSHTSPLAPHTREGVRRPLFF
jgi:hypothetical protein